MQVDMNNLSIDFTQPKIRKNCYISHPDEIILCDMSDIIIHKCSKLQNSKGYCIKIFIKNEYKSLLNSIDDIALNSLLLNNQSWFDNNLTEDDISAMFRRSFCGQTSTMNIILTHDDANIKNCSSIFLDGKKCELSDAISIISDSKFSKRYTLNLNVKLAGLYVYPTHTSNKWIIKQMNIYENEELEIDSKEDIELFWKDAVDESMYILDETIKNAEKEKVKIENIYRDILQTPVQNKDWETKLIELKRLTQNIIF
jgi:hypothetical protein